MHVTYFGHSVLQIETCGQTILFDPFITGNPLAELVTSVSSLRPEVIFLTHAHFDHWGDTLAIAKQSNALIVANHEIIEYVKKNGYDNVEAMNIGGSGVFEWGTVTMTYARHSSSFPDGTYGGTPNGYLIRSQGICIYNAGDTDTFSEMSWIGQDNKIQLALLPIGDQFTMGLKGSIRAARLLKPEITVPIHYNTFPPIHADTEKWLEEMEKSGLGARILKPGESIDL